jgi:hypothetical protein
MHNTGLLVGSVIDPVQALFAAEASGWVNGEVEWEASRVDRIAPHQDQGLLGPERRLV